MSDNLSGRPRLPSDDLDLRLVEQEIRAKYDWFDIWEMEGGDSMENNTYSYNNSGNCDMLDSKNPFESYNQSAMQGVFSDTTSDWPTSSGNPYQYIGSTDQDLFSTRSISNPSEFSQLHQRSYVQALRTSESMDPERSADTVMDVVHDKSQGDARQEEQSWSSIVEVESERPAPLNSTTSLIPEHDVPEDMNSDDEFEVVTSRKTRQKLKSEKKRAQAQQLDNRKLSSKTSFSSVNQQQSTNSINQPCNNNNSSGEGVQLESSPTHSTSNINCKPSEPVFTDNWSPVDLEVIMPPNRRRNDHHHVVAAQPHGHGHAHQNGHGGMTSRPMKCCVPTECFQPGKLIYHEDIGTSDLEVVKIICNNEKCEQGGFMHKECFDAWEQTILTFLRSCGRARSWSEKQRLQNLWTKKGYDLAFKACPCKCGKGHIRKDLDWIQPERSAPIAIPDAGENGENQQLQNNIEHVAGQLQGLAIQNGDAKKKKKSKSREARPTLAISAPVPHPNNNQARETYNGLGKSNGQATHVGSADTCGSPAVGGMMARNRMNSVSSNGSNTSSSSGVSGEASPDGQFYPPPNTLAMSMPNSFKFQRRNSKDYMERSRVFLNPRRDSGGLFHRRMDFSSFNALPRHKLNSYHIKMEEESHGNDETRNLVLSTLMNCKTNRYNCILCQTSLPIFDRFPLIDGTFFLSPRQHSQLSLEVLYNGRPNYLSAVCMACLEGWFTVLCCKMCRTPWDGSSFVLGSCYTYDIFAAFPCCDSHLQCGNCNAVTMNRGRDPPTFFSHFSNTINCPKCGYKDCHGVKALPEIYNKFCI